MNNDTIERFLADSRRYLGLTEATPNPAPRPLPHKDAAMKRSLASLMLVLASSVALALPTPGDIEAAVAAGQLSQAETMLQEVVKEKPASAMAHYELGQVLARAGRHPEARRELLEAQRLDPTLKFARDPGQFRALLDKLPAAIPAPSASPQPVATPAAPALPAEPTFPWTFVLLGGGAALLIWRLVSRAAATRAGLGARSPLAAAGPVAPVRDRQGEGPGNGMPAQNAGSGIGGAVIGGIAGLAAGYGLAKVLDHNNEDPATQKNAADNGFIPIDSASPPDYGTFDAGSGDSWDDGGSPGDDDNW